MAKHTTIINDFAGGLGIDEIGTLAPQVIKRTFLRQPAILPDIINARHFGFEGVRYFRANTTAFLPGTMLAGELFFDFLTNILHIGDGTNTVTPTTSAINVKVGDFTLDTSTGNQSITGVGFTPKIIYLISTTDTGNVTGVNDDWNKCIGCARTSTSRFVISQNAEDNVAASGNWTMGFNDVTSCVLLATPGTSTIIAQADFVSFDSDGFTLDNVVAHTTGYRVGYIAIGGDDLTDTYAAIFQSDAAVDADTQLTGVGFTPDHVTFMGLHDDTSPSNFDSRSVMGVGFTTGNTSTDYAIGQMIYKTASNTSDTQISGSTASVDSYRTLNPYNLITGASALLAYQFKSFDVDGFTLNKNSNNEGGFGGRQFWINYLATKGGNVQTGLFTLNTSTGNQSITGVGFKPLGIIFISNFQYAAGSIQVGQQCISFTDGTNHFLVGGAGDDAEATTTMKRYQRDDVVIRKVNTSGTVQTDCSLVSLDLDGFTISVDTAPSNAETVGFMAFG